MTLEDWPFPRAVPYRSSNADPVPFVGYPRAYWDLIGRKSRRVMSFLLEVQGETDAAELRRAICALADDFTILASHVHVLDGRASFVERPFDPGVIDFVDWSEGTARHQSKLRRHVEHEQRRYIDVLENPLFSAQIIKLRANSHLVYFLLHHLVTDQASNNILQVRFRDHILASKRHGDRAPREAIKVLDFFEWQRSSSDTWETKHRQYWIDKLAGNPAFGAERKVRVDGTLKTMAGRRAFFIDADTTRNLQLAAKEASTMPAMAFLAVYLMTLADWLGRHEIVVQCVDNGRGTPALQGTVGWVSNHLVLKISLVPGEPPAQFVRRVFLEFRKSYGHYDFSRVMLAYSGVQSAPLFNWLVSRSYISQHAAAADDAVGIGENASGDETKQQANTSQPSRPEIRVKRLPLPFHFPPTPLYSIFSGLGARVRLDLFYDKFEYTDLNIEAFGATFLRAAAKLSGSR